MVIDCHLHHMPAPLNSRYVSWLKESGNKSFGPSYLWDKPAFEDTPHMLDKMDASGVDLAVVTHSANMTAILGLDTDEARLPQRISWLNDCMLAKLDETGGRMVPTAWIDPRLGAAAVAEMERVADNGFAGFSVLTAYKAGDALRYIDHPDFAGFWQKAAECDLPVFVHFSSQFSTGQREYLEGYMAYTLIHAGMDQLMEDTICTTRLILSGLFDRHPNLKVIMGQLGGLFPFMLERFDMLYTMYAAGAQKTGLDVLDKNDMGSFLRRLSDYTSNIYVDTHSMGAPAIQAATDILGRGHVLYGSDYPITPDSWGRDRGLELVRGLPAEEAVKQEILGGAASKLFGL